MKKLSPSKILFIKLGAGGAYEKECIEKGNIVKLSYKEIDHELCLFGRWSAVKKDILKKYKVSEGVATFHLTQIKYFYEAGDDILWITFYNNKLWWCFADKKVFLDPDGTRYRKIIGKWSCKDLNGKFLFLENLSGRLTKISRFMGTICLVAESDYLVKKINGDELPEIKEAEEAFINLRDRIVKIIKTLNPKDFELLIDLIFRNAGWQRIGVVGKTQKTIDLALYHPITEERAVVQIKCQSNLEEFKKYKNKFIEMTEYDKFFYIAHTPDSALSKYQTEESNINLYFADKVAELAINSGLFNWILKILG